MTVAALDYFRCQTERDEARRIARIALHILRQMPVGLDELDERLADLPDWTEEYADDG